MNLPENSNSLELREILDALPVLVFLERAGRIVFANAEARQMLGAEGEWVERPVEDVLWGLFPGTAEPQTELTGTRRGSPFHATMVTKDRRLQPVEGTYSLINQNRRELGRGGPDRSELSVREGVIVAHLGGGEKAPKSRLMEDVLASIPEAVAIEHGDHLLYTNRAFTEMFGYTAEEASGGSLRDLIVPETRLIEHATMLRAVDEKGRSLVETVRMNRKRELVDVSLHVAPLLVDGMQVGYVYTLRDIGENKETEAKLQHDAMHDVLTGLPNRALFLDRANLALSRRARRPDQGCGVLFLDLDKFKQINDALGHAAGDMALKSVAERLRSVLRPQDTAARLGGDEFAILVENILAPGDLEIVARRILREMERPIDIFGRQAQCGASIGAAMAGKDHLSADLLMRDADFAMYRAKQAGGLRCEVFDKHLEVFVSSQQARERELRQVVDKRLFEFRFEPIYQLGNGLLEGFESSICWRRPDGTIEDFPDLLAAAQETGLSITLGREAMENACRRLRDWSERAEEKDLLLTVNLTNRQFYHSDIVLQLKRIFAATGADPSRLAIEVPESVVNENPDSAIAIMQRMVDLNVRIAVDDFGSALAPLNHLVRLPIDMLKLDAKLTAAATSKGRQRAVLESLIRLSRTLGISVTAQGIHTQEQLAALCQMGCSLGQGPLLSAPVETERALNLAHAGSWAMTPSSVNRP